MDFETPSRNELRLGFEFEGDIGELFVDAEQDGFRGHASAWIRTEDLVTFSRSLDGVVERRLDQARLEGGALTSKGTRLSLRVFPIGSRGYLALEVLLVDPELDPGVRDWQNRLSLRLEAAPAPVARFAQSLRRLAAGEREEVRLLSP